MPRRSDLELSAEERLHLAEKRMRLAQSVAHLGSWEIDLVTGEMWASDEAFRIYGLEIAVDNRLPLKTAQARPIGEHRARLDEALRKLLAGQEPYDVEFDILRASDGARRSVRSLAEVVWNESGRPVAVNGTLQDVTEERATALALAASEERARLAVEQAADAILSLAPDRTPVDANLRAVELWGLGRDELRARPLAQLFVEGEFDRQPARFAELDRGETAVAERTVLRGDGTTVPVELRGRRLSNGTYQIILRDFTERKRAEHERAVLERQLHRAQRLEAIGMLAGGIAHDFNNILTVIGASASLGLLERPLSSPAHDAFAEIAAAVESAAALTQQLLAFSRKQVIAPRVLDLNEVIRRVGLILRRVLGEGIEVVEEQAADLGKTRMDHGQVEQILVNLAVNARDAMDGKGRLTIATRNVTLDEAFARRHTLVAPGPFVELSVTDTGCGMSPERAAHVFEPFFTTKGLGKGTGLGLATVYGAVRQNGGHVDVASQLGRGTTFRIVLPRVDAAPEPRRDARPGSLPRGREHVILVEDDDVVRVAATRMLAWLGYQVHAHASGAEALAALPGLPPEAALLVTDVVMPGMNGRELADRMLALRPDLRVLYASGYTHDVITHEGVLDEGIEFLEKPYSLESLGRRVREILDQAARPVVAG